LKRSRRAKPAASSISSGEASRDPDRAAAEIRVRSAAESSRQRSSQVGSSSPVLQIATTATRKITAMAMSTRSVRTASG
jgi:hypothetical protein